MAVLKGRVALVTGGSRGIGRAIAVSLADAGAAVAVNYLEKAADAQQVVETIRGRGGKAMAVGADVSQGAAVNGMIATVERELGPIDVLVNNAGLGLVRTIDDLTEEDFDRTIAVNLKSVFLCTQAVISGMRARKWGRIVNISSGAARGAGGVGPHYNASKAGMEGMTRGYAARLVKDGITVNAVAPSLIQTDMVVRGLASSAARIPLGRFGTPEECRPGRDDAGRQRVHDRPDGRAERRHCRSCDAHPRQGLVDQRAQGPVGLRGDRHRLHARRQRPGAGAEPERPGAGDRRRRLRAVGEQQHRPLSRQQVARRSIAAARPQARAEVDRWIDWQATEFNGAWRYAFSAIVRRNPGVP